METYNEIHNQQLCEQSKIAALVHQLERCIDEVISSDNPQVGSNWKFVCDHKMYLEQLSIWLALFRCNCVKGKKPKSFPVFLREQHKFDECKITEYTRETWKQLNIYVQSLGNESLFPAFVSLYEYFDVEEEYSRDFE